MSYIIPLNEKLKDLQDIYNKHSSMIDDYNYSLAELLRMHNEWSSKYKNKGKERSDEYAKKIIALDQLIFIEKEKYLKHEEVVE